MEVHGATLSLRALGSFQGTWKKKMIKAPGVEESRAIRIRRELRAWQTNASTCSFGRRERAGALLRRCCAGAPASPKRCQGQLGAPRTRIQS